MKFENGDSKTKEKERKKEGRLQSETMAGSETLSREMIEKWKRGGKKMQIID